MTDSCNVGSTATSNKTRLEKPSGLAITTDLQAYCLDRSDDDDEKIIIIIA